MDTTVPMCTEANGNFKSLLIGLGGAALPEYMLQHCPKGTELESVEYDPRVVKAATNFFGLQLAPNINEVENKGASTTLYWLTALNQVAMCQMHAETRLLR